MKKRILLYGSFLCFGLMLENLDAMLEKVLLHNSVKNTVPKLVNKLSNGILVASQYDPRFNLCLRTDFQPHLLASLKQWVRYKKCPETAEEILNKIQEQLSRKILIPDVEDAEQKESHFATLLKKSSINDFTYLKHQITTGTITDLDLIIMATVCIINKNEIWREDDSAITQALDCLKREILDELNEVFLQPSYLPMDPYNYVLNGIIYGFRGHPVIEPTLTAFRRPPQKTAPGTGAGPAPFGPSGPACPPFPNIGGPGGAIFLTTPGGVGGGAKWPTPADSGSSSSTGGADATAGPAPFPYGNPGFPNRSGTGAGAATAAPSPYSHPSISSYQQNSGNGGYSDGEAGVKPIDPSSYPMYKPYAASTSEDGGDPELAGKTTGASAGGAAGGGGRADPSKYNTTFRPSTHSRTGGSGSGVRVGAYQPESGGGDWSDPSGYTTFRPSTHSRTGGSGSGVRVGAYQPESGGGDWSDPSGYTTFSQPRRPATGNRAGNEVGTYQPESGGSGRANIAGYATFNGSAPTYGPPPSWGAAPAAEAGASFDSYSAGAGAGPSGPRSFASQPSYSNQFGGTTRDGDAGVYPVQTQLFPGPPAPNTSGSSFPLTPPPPYSDGGAGTNSAVPASGSTSSTAGGPGKGEGADGRGDPAGATAAFQTFFNRNNPTGSITNADDLVSALGTALMYNAHEYKTETEQRAMIDAALGLLAHYSSIGTVQALRTQFIWRLIYNETTPTLTKKILKEYGNREKPE